MSLPVFRPQGSETRRHGRRPTNTATVVAATATLTGMLSSSLLLAQVWEGSAPSVETKTTESGAWLLAAPVADAPAGGTAEPAGAAAVTRSVHDRRLQDRASRSHRKARLDAEAAEKKRRARVAEINRRARVAEKNRKARVAEINRRARQEARERRAAEARTERRRQHAEHQHTTRRTTSERAKRASTAPRREKRRVQVRTTTRKGIPARVARLNWRAMAQCESTNNPRAVNPSGKYHGLYQFDRGTWRSVGGSGLPSRATRAEQTYRAQLLFISRGSSPWPQCGRLLYS